MKNPKVLGVITYITWIGWLIAYFLRDKEDSFVRRHLNQAIALTLVSTLAGFVSRAGGIFGLVASVASLAALVLSIMGIIKAAQGSEEPLLLVGEVNWIR